VEEKGEEIGREKDEEKEKEGKGRRMRKGKTRLGWWERERGGRRGGRRDRVAKD